MTRVCLIAGYAIAAVTAIMVTVLTTMAISNPDSTVTLPMLLVGVVTSMLGSSAAAALATAYAVRAAARYSDGVSDTIERLASALPGGGQGGQVRRLPG